MGRITVYENNKRKGSTSQAFNVTTKKELMREYTLEFSILNNNPIYKEITVSSVFENKGQLFDITGIDTDSGKENISSISAEHVSYRTNNYFIPANYAFVGTVREIANDILILSGASVEFKIGECCDIGTVSFSLNNEKEITARAALFGLAAIGVELEYDNFTINIPQRIGENAGKVFRFGVDLQNFRRRWQIGNGWTYDINIADIQKSKNYNGVTFGLGDDVIAEDSFIGDSIKNRIISYIENEDNPALNSVTMGVFIADTESENVETNHIANTANNTANDAKKTADNSVQQNQKYSNVSISHKDGFVAEHKAGTRRVIMNADDCFIIQILQNGKWSTVNSLETFGLLVERLTTQDAKKTFYATIGKNENGNDGFFLYANTDEGWQRFLDIWQSTSNNSVIESKVKNLVFMCPENKGFEFVDKAGNSKGTLVPNGGCSCVTTYQSAGGIVYEMEVENGIIMNIKKRES